MRGTQERVSREELQETLETLWGRYLPTLNALPEEDLSAWVRQQGFHSSRDFLAHIAAWWQQGLRAIDDVQRGEPVQRNWKNDDDFNARAVHNAQQWTLEQVEEAFETTRTHLSGVLAELSDEDFANEQIYYWLYETIFVHYQQHVPPGDPQIPAQQHTETNQL